MATIQDRFRSVVTRVDNDELAGMKRYFGLVIEVLDKGTVDGKKTEDPKESALFALREIAAILENETPRRTPQDTLAASP